MLSFSECTTLQLAPYTNELKWQHVLCYTFDRYSPQCAWLVDQPPKLCEQQSFSRCQMGHSSGNELLLDSLSLVRFRIESSWCEMHHLLLLSLIKVSFLISWCALASCVVQVYMFWWTQKFSKSGLHSQMTRWTHSSHLLQKSSLLFERYWGNTTNLALFLKHECLHRIKQVGVFRGSISEHKDLRQGWTMSECQLKTSSQIGH